MRSTSWVILISGIGLILAADAAGQAKTRANVDAGKQLYRQHCSACHGLDAKGNGSMYDPGSPEPLRRIPPPDLTVLSEHNGGNFPADRVRNAISSKEPVPAHGTSNMPAWCDVFFTQKHNAKVIDARVRNLTAYIESLQVKGK
jgi:mono/diheme cytochrome c family protein